MGKSFYRLRKGVACRHSTAALTGILKVVISGLTGIILIVLSTTNLQFQDWFVSISLRLILRIVTADITAIVWSSCRQLLHLVGVSDTILSRVLSAHRTRLRIL